MHSAIVQRGKAFVRLASLACVFAGALVVAGCGGSSGSNGITPVPTGPSGPSTPGPVPNSARILRADVGAVCETLVSGEAYSRTPPALACAGSTDPYSAVLDGSRSTSSDGTPLSYAWAFVSKPAGSNAQLVGADTARPTFTPDKGGPYAIQLVVTASGVASSRAVALVVALDDATLNPNLATNPTAAA
jgi:hypothetical protein